MQKRKALGRGLSILIPDLNREDFFMCPIELIDENPDQPRVDLGGKDLTELANSIREKGVITPLIVSKKRDRFQLIAGQRRLVAAKSVGLKKVPVIVREITPSERLELALIENIHRKDLNPIEEATAYKRLIDDTGMSHEEIAKRLGKERSTITNMLRILNLPSEVQGLIAEGKLSMSHARALAGVKDSKKVIALARLIVEKDISVRRLEEIVKKEKKRKELKDKREKNIYLKSVEDQLREILGTKVELKKGKKGGKLIIHFFSDEELERIIEILER
mgnify:CR=1 FL=1